MENMNKQHVMLLFGGESSEHEVSIASARNVFDAIDKATYELSLVFIGKDGRWWLIDSFDDHAHPTVQLSLQPGTSTFTTSDARSITPDILFPVLHGRNGEDGSVQGLAQLLHLPIVGCDMTASVLAMDKIAAKEVFAHHGLDVLPFAVHRQGEPTPDYAEIASALGPTLFVKPSRAGSSVGISRVTNEAAFANALDEAHVHDEFVLIEQAANHPRELEVAVLGTPPHHEASVVGEIRPDGEFYSYDSKYSDSSTSSVVIPADISDELAQTIREQALAAYSALKCRGFARVDFLLDDTGLYINEINTIPGFTDISMYPKLWEASGLSYSALIDRLIALAR